MRRIPAMAWQNMLIPALAKMFPGQAIMFDVVDQFQIPDRDERLVKPQ